MIADIHGNIEALDAVLSSIDALGIQTVYCLGDLVGYGPNPNEVIERLTQRGIPSVQGNYDEGTGYDRMACGCDYADERAMDIGSASLAWTQKTVTSQNKDRLRKLPERLDIRLGNYRIHMVHGSPDRNNEYLYEDTPRLEEIAEALSEDILICGHTHLPFHRRVQGKHITNAGSVGKPKHGNAQSVFAMVSAEWDELKVDFHYVSYEVEKTAEKITRSELPNELAVMLLQGTAKTPK